MAAALRGEVTLIEPGSAIYVQTKSVTFTVQEPKTKYINGDMREIWYWEAQNFISMEDLAKDGYLSKKTEQITLAFTF